MDEFLSRAGELMTGQHALITSRQAQRLGANRERIASLVRNGHWERVEARLYGPTGVPMTWHRRLMSAVLLGPDGTLVSHRAGAALRGVGGFLEPDPEVSVPRGRRLRRAGVIVHESTDLDLAGACTIDGIPTTGRARLAVDLGAVVSPKRYRQALRELRFGRGLSVEDMLRAYLRHSRRGRDGTGSLRDWLDRYYGLQGTPESGLEQIVLDAILDAAIRAPVAQHWLACGTRRYRLDFAYPDLKIAIEVHGSQHDEDPDVASNDVVRTAALEAAGWTVLVIRQKTFASDLANAIAILRHCVTASGQV